MEIYFGWNYLQSDDEYILKIVVSSQESEWGKKARAFALIASTGVGHICNVIANMACRCLAGMIAFKP